MTCVFSGLKLSVPRIAGVVMLDPQFHLNRPMPPKSRPNTSWSGRTKTFLMKRYETVHDSLLDSRWEPHLTAIFRRALKLKQLAIAWRLPGNANLLLLESLTKLVQLEVPVLALTAIPPTSAPAGFDYFGFVESKSRQKIARVRISGTTHSFVENGGREAVAKAITEWLAQLPDPVFQGGLKATR